MITIFDENELKLDQIVYPTMFRVLPGEYIKVLGVLIVNESSTSKFVHSTKIKIDHTDLISERQFNSEELTEEVTVEDTKIPNKKVKNKKKGDKK